MNVGSLFSGIGGLDLGLERAGMRVIWQSEIDSYASRVLAKHWPNVPNLGDIAAVDWSEIQRPDLVCGGFPCQPVSAAGRRLGDQDARWLWPEFSRCLRELRPRYALLENVPGLFSLGFRDVLGDLAALGFDAEWGCIPAVAVGAPHLRWRVFVVADAASDLWRASRNDGPEAPDGSGASVANAERWPAGSLTRRTRSTASEGPDGESARPGWWAAEPDVGRVANGIPRRVDRLRCLGNAVVPQVAELIGRMIMARVAHGDAPSTASGNPLNEEATL